MCDVLTGYIVDAAIGAHDHGERKFALGHLEKFKKFQGRKDLIIFDRGYPSAELLAYLEQNGFKYLMRVKRRFNAEIGATDKSDFYIQLKFGDAVFKTRAIKLELDTGKTEVMLTNLAGNQFGKSEFKALYFMRWPIETKYNLIKNQLELESFTGRTPRTVKQDFYANMYLANLVQSTKEHVDELIKEGATLKGNKHEYQANTSLLISQLKPKLVLCFLMDDPNDSQKLLEGIAQDAARFKSVVRPGRSYERKNKVKVSFKRKAKRPL